MLRFFAGTGMASAYYEKPYCRISVYLVGILFGWLVSKDMLPRRIPAWFYVLGYTAIFVLGYVMIWGLQTEAQYDMSHSQSSWADPSATTDAWYNAMARPVWALLLCASSSTFATTGTRVPSGPVSSSVEMLPSAPSSAPASVPSSAPLTRRVLSPRQCHPPPAARCWHHPLPATLIVSCRGA